MRKMLLMLVLATCPALLCAQSAKDEIKKNIRCSASNYMVYPGPTQHQLTPPPSGAKPFYISHYGRHGSRYLSHLKAYDIPCRTLATADSLGKLTTLGKDVKRRMELIRQDAENRLGELTPLGAKQHQDIVTRMVRRFPEVFEGNATVDARSTTVVRCMLSMENAMVQLLRLNPKLKVHHNATHRDMDFLNFQDKQLMAQKMDSATAKVYKAFASKYEHNERLMQSLFNDTAYVRQHVDAGTLNYYLFKVACNLQNTEMSKKVTLYDIFTDDEIYRNWLKENAWWYIAFAGSTINGGKQPFTQRNLLRKIITDADSCISLKRPGAQLRFGHETVVMPLTALLNLNGYGLATDKLESLDKKGWANYRIFPMGSNIQFIFYRKDADDKDVLFKVLLNENEARLPLKSNIAPYYHWEDFKEYFLRKLDEYEEDI